MNPSTSRTDPQSQFLNFLPSHSQSISGSPSGGSSPAAEFNATSAATTKSPFGVPSPLSSGGTSLSHTAGSMSTVNRLGTGAGSPSHDLGGGTRLYSKR
ncbi:hypothetical protein KEM55_000426 [Ascosphaera atra]|nr:hypothetical protein KEM55_000426 [Ascosphaera atra]